MSGYNIRYYMSLRYMARMAVVYCGLYVLIAGPVECAVVYPWLKEYWLRNSPQGRLILASVGEKAEACREDHPRDEPKAVVGTICEAIIRWNSPYDCRLSVHIDHILGSEGPRGRGPSGIVLQLGPNDLDRVRIVGRAVEDISPLPIGFTVSLCTIGAITAAVTIVLFHCFVKPLWFSQGQQVRALRGLVKQRIQWWSKQGVIIGTLKRVDGELCWNIRHLFYRTTMQVQTDDGKLHTIPFTSLGLVFRLHCESM
jgi:hypothetical protein